MSAFAKKIYEHRENIEKIKNMLENIIKVEGLENLGIDFIEKNKLNESYILKLNIDLKDIKSNNNINSEFKITNKNNKLSFSLKTTGTDNVEIISDNIVDFRKKVDVFLEKYPLDEMSNFFPIFQNQ